MPVLATLAFETHAGPKPFPQGMVAEVAAVPQVGDRFGLTETEQSWISKETGLSASIWTVTDVLFEVDLRLQFLSPREVDELPDEDKPCPSEPSIWIALSPVSASTN